MANNTKEPSTVDIEALRAEVEQTKADAAAIKEEASAMLAEAKAMFDEVKKIKETSVQPADMPGISAEELKILAGVEANEARMKDKVPLVIPSDPLNSANRYQFVGVGHDAVKIEKDKQIFVSRAMHDAATEAMAQARNAEKKMQAQADEWNPDAWQQNLSR